MEGKIKMVNATGIVAIVFGSLYALTGILLASLSGAIARTTRCSWQWDPWSGNSWCNWYTAASSGIMVAMIIVGLIILALAVTQIILGAMLLKRSKNLQENPTACNGLLIGLLVLSFFIGGWIMLILSIIALCMKGGENLQQNTSNFGYNNAGTYNASAAPMGGYQQGNPAQGKINDLESTIARYKQYKADGVITEEQFKKKVEELVTKMMDEN